jgi:hypothetical protein
LATFSFFATRVGHGLGAAASGAARGASPTQERMENMSGCEARATLGTPAISLVFE